jgi:hypothetical protein
LALVLRPIVLVDVKLHKLYPRCGLEATTKFHATTIYRVFENRVLKRIFGPKREEMTVE